LLETFVLPEVRRQATAQEITLKAAAPVYGALRHAGLFLALALIKAMLAKFDKEP